MALMEGVLGRKVWRGWCVPFGGIFQVGILSKREIKLVFLVSSNFRRRKIDEIWIGVDDGVVFCRDSELVAIFGTRYRNGCLSL